MAIFAIAAASISVAINTSSNMYKQENIRLQTISAADSIIQQLRSRGVGTKFIDNSKINGLIDFFGDDTSTEKYAYIYFDYTDLNTVVIDKTQYKSTGLEKNFQDCKSKNTDNKRFGAEISIERTNGEMPSSDLSQELTVAWYYNVYTINVKVWNLEQGENSAAEASTSVSR